MAGVSPKPDLKRSLFRPEYKAWNNLKTRCYNPNTNNWHRYGGRGIIVCEKWLNFEGFLEDMGRKPSPLHSIDRIDNNGDYCKENCKWSTKEEQVRNRGTNVYLEYKGNKMIIKDIAKEVGLNFQLIQIRMKKGMSLDEAIHKPYKYTKNECIL